MTFSPTEEQSAILDAVASSTSNLMIQARAGCGKTATLTLIDAVSPGPNLLLCFNKSVATEAVAKVRSTTTVKTFNSLGHKIWASAIAGKIFLDPQKIHHIFRWLVEMEDRPARNYLWSLYDQVTQGVNLARALGYIPAEHAKADKRLCNRAQLAALLDERPDDYTLTLIDRILIESIRQAYLGSIDFADQTYMPALFGGTYPRFPLTLVDEYQDLSPVNHAMVAKLVKGRRQIGVGDEAQAIYGFRGASASSMRDATAAFDMRTLPLTLSFRCPSAIVSNVHWRVPDMRASTQGGTVNHSWTHGIADDTCTVICRNNAPLMAAAMKLIHAGRSVNVSGTDLGPKLIKLLTKLGPETLTQTQVLDAIDSWEAPRLAAESKSADDLANCLRVFARAGTSLGAAIAYAQHLFGQSGSVQFITGHKSKGLEFDHVYHLDKFLLKAGQDLNVRYVIDTRARRSLTYIETGAPDA